MRLRKLNTATWGAAWEITFFVWQYRAAPHMVLISASSPWVLIKQMISHKLLSIRCRLKRCDSIGYTGAGEEMACYHCGRIIYEEDEVLIW